MEYVIDANTHGKTVLEILKKQLGMSHAMIKHLKFLEDGITLNGSHVTVRRQVCEGDVLCLAVEDRDDQYKLTPCDLDIKIAYEDDDVVVPDKPSDMPTHQSHGHYTDTVANALAYRYSQKGIPFVFRPVNRLDRNTSGLLLIARNRISAGYLAEAMREHRIQKQYVAILEGVLPQDSGVIDTYMRRTEQSVIVREVCEEGQGGDRAITEYSVICRSDTHTLVYAYPKTGRTHQLRVHFASMGCPIEGDDMYGSESKLIGRHALHSTRVTFPRSKGEGKITVTSPLPDDMYRLATAVFGERLEDIDGDIKKYILPQTEEKDDEFKSAHRETV
jgi:23S rRNA pseudouridine1911/1915/1917 synthase